MGAPRTRRINGTLTLSSFCFLPNCGLDTVKQGQSQWHDEKRAAGRKVELQDELDGVDADGPAQRPGRARWLR
jgi:hypothetical protein